MELQLRPLRLSHLVFFFFFQAEDGIRDLIVTGVQTCALPISTLYRGVSDTTARPQARQPRADAAPARSRWYPTGPGPCPGGGARRARSAEIGRASCRERV